MRFPFGARCTITLHGMGFDVEDAATGEAALDVVGQAPFDVVLLDINMPGMGGIRACREIRRNLPRLGILMLTVRDREDDKVAALDAGADDYITKPFGIRELAARIRAAVRRSSASQADPDATIRIGNIELDPARREVRKAGAPVHLTPKEFDLVRYLMAHAGLPITPRACCTRYGARSTAASWSTCGRLSGNSARSSKTTPRTRPICSPTATSATASRKPLRNLPKRRRDGAKPATPEHPAAPNLRPFFETS